MPYEIEKEEHRKVLRKMQKDFIEEKSREVNTVYQADLSAEPIECYHCKAKIIWNGPGLIGAIEDAWDNKDYKIFSPNHSLQCPECHRKIDSILLPKERVKPWDKHPLVKQPYSPEDIKQFAKESWTKYEPKKDKPMGKKVLLKGYSCEYCNHAFTSDKPIHGEIINDHVWLDNTKHKCPECLSESKTVHNHILWDQPIKKPTVQETMDEYNKEAKKMDVAFKFLIFVAIWLGAALAIYGLSFVPWLPILASFWILTKNLTYALTRWYSLCGLFVTLLIFYQWHKQAIRDKLAYLSNIYGTRRRYRKMVSRKESVTEDELKSFVNEVNHRDKLQEQEIAIKPDLDVTITEDEIPF